MKGKLEQYADWMHGFEHKIVDFHTSVWEDDGRTEIVFYKDFKPFHKGRTELEEGVTYVTIRCGLTGIYTCINQWMGGRWGAECLDGSETIAYRKLKPYEEFKFKP